MAKRYRILGQIQVKKETNDIIEKKVAALLAALTNSEKWGLLHGHENSAYGKKVGNAGYLPGVPRLGIPEIRMYDGPAGVTSNRETTGFPVQLVLGGTWDDGLAYAFGAAVAKENASLGGNCQLGSQYDICRIPHYVRNKDAVGEDPCMVSRMARQQTRGIQDQNVMAVAKHYLAYVQKPVPAKKMCNMKLDEQTFREMYLPGFEAAIEENVSAIMTACTMINGEYATASDYYLNQVLHEELGFKGFVMSDWKINPFFSVRCGLDMEMPTAAWNGEDYVEQALKKGEISDRDIDQAVKHILHGMGSCGLLSNVTLQEDGTVVVKEDMTLHMEDYYTRAVDSGMLEAHAKIAEKIVQEGSVLLKNEAETLPITGQKYKNVAMLGSGAIWPFTGENQERSYGRISRFVSPFEAIRQLGEKEGIVQYHEEEGIDLVGRAIPAEMFYQNESGAQKGMCRYEGILEKDYAPLIPKGPMGGGFAIYDKDGGLHDIAGKNGEIGTLAGVDERICFSCGSENGRENKTYKNGLDGNAFVCGDAYTWVGYLEPPEDGLYDLFLHAIGGEASFDINLDGKEFSNIGIVRPREGAQWPWSSLLCTRTGMDIIGKRVELIGKKRYPIKVIARGLLEEKDLQLELAWVTPSDRKEHYENAIKLAAENDLTVLFVHQGSNAEQLMPPALRTLDLDKEQKKLTENVLRTAKENRKKTVVVLNIARPVLMDGWQKYADSILNMWLPGQEGGRVTAQILSGQINPSGKLTMSFPARDCDTPVTDTKAHYQRRYLGEEKEGGTLQGAFDEGIFFGYRWFEKEKIQPAFGFGHGLSYTKFDYSNLRVISEPGSVTVSFKIQNIGNCMGDEIAQIYAKATKAPAYMQMAEHTLIGYHRESQIMPGEVREIQVEIPDRMLSSWDIRKPGKDKWKLFKKGRVICVGGSLETLNLNAVIEGE